MSIIMQIMKVLKIFYRVVKKPISFEDNWYFIDVAYFYNVYETKNAKRCVINLNTQI